MIDVRSPAEFAEDHIPGAINLPALSNEERAIVGTIYKQDSPFRARKIGAAMVARNVAAHLDGPLADRDGGWRPLVHCWRGGQRSGSFASILGQIGWRTETLEGGYRAFRALVHKAVYEDPVTLRIVLLDGNTGTAKTDILGRLAGLGVQALDLEGLANHRGSLLGARAGGQPSQKAFETAIATALLRCDPTRPLLIEAESSKIGRLIIPPSLWTAMSQAPRIDVTAPVEARVAWLSQAYADLTTEPATFARRLEPLRAIRGNETVDRWLAALDEGDMPALARDLIVAHYDPAYAKSRMTRTAPILGRVEADNLDEAGRDDLARQIAALLSGR